MAAVLLIMIYTSYTILGMGESMLGPAWPAMRLDLHMPFSMAGILSMLLTGGTVISNLLVANFIKKFGTSKVVFGCILLTAASLHGFSAAVSLGWLCAFALTLGLGGGAVDAALNNYVALHYEAKHMNWLHGLWGVGTITGPFIMSLFIINQNGWRNGYFVIALAQLGLAGLLFFALPLWKNHGAVRNEELRNDGLKASRTNPFSLPGAKLAMLSFFCYCAVETSAALWGSSYLVNRKGVSVAMAAKWISLFFLGITAGRFIAGVAAIKFNNRNMIRIGQLTTAAGILFLLLPLPQIDWMIGFLLIGLGNAPLYPCMLNDTPRKFGGEMSQAMIGVFMAAASLGSTFVPPLFGYLATLLNIAIFPIYMFVLLLIMVLCVELGNKSLMLRG